MIARLLLAAALIVPPPVAHQVEEPPKWTVQPATPAGPTNQAHFSYDGQPGQQFEDYVAVSNLSEKALNFTVYATDAFTSADGSFSLLPLMDPPKMLGSWLAMPPRSYAIPSGRRVIIPVKLTVPANATPGDHAAGIVASVTEEVTSPEGKKVNVDRRVGTRVYLRVAGPVQPAFAVENVDVGYAGATFASGKMTVTYRLRNTGNIRVHGDSRVKVTGPFGINLAETDKGEIPEMLPGSEITLTREVSGIVALGSLNASVIVNPVSSEGLLPVATRSGSIWATPWAAIGLLVVVVAAVALVIWWRRRRAIVLTPWPTTP